MALILMCGYPASGKSTVTDELASLLRSDGHNVAIIRDGDNIEQSSGDSDVTAESRRRILYQDSTLEKKTRARLRAATERSLNASNIVICDSLNYIKGFRYEMFCVAKTTATRYCVVYCSQEADWCIARDAERIEGGSDGYGEDLCRALVRRFEEPVGKNRWDSPLHVVDVRMDGWKDGLKGIEESAVTTGKRLAPSMATRHSVKVGADVLGMLDRVTREAEGVIVEEIHGGRGIGDKVFIPGVSKPLCLTRMPRIAELRNMRRSYLNVVRMQPPVGTSREELVEEYIQYINAQLDVRR